MRITELLDVDFAHPSVGDYLDIENDDTYVEGRIIEADQGTYVIDIGASGFEYLSQLGMLDMVSEAEYRGRKVQLSKPTRGDVKKFKVYVRNPGTGKIVKVNFGDPNMRIRKSNPARRRSFRARHNCANPGPRTKARYWSCRKW